MDRLSFVFSLLLIVSVTTTFGSVIRAKNPYGEELEALLKRSQTHTRHFRLKPEIEKLSSDARLDHHPEMVPNPQELEALLKRSDDAPTKLEDETDLGSGGELTDEVLQEFLDNSGYKGRPKVAIGIQNNSTYPWEAATTDVAGTLAPEFPQCLGQGEYTLSMSLGKEGEAEGCFAYFIPDIYKTLGVMWKDNIYNDKTEINWNIALFDGRQVAKDIYAQLDEHHMTPSTEFSNIDLLGSQLKVRGRISNHTEAKLEIHVDYV